jgi:hypothetical protein
MKFTFSITKKEIALPLRIGWTREKSYWAIGIHILIFALQIMHVNMPKKSTYEIPVAPMATEPDVIKPTKAYADERQKAPRNRRRKPKKAMANLYQLQ